MSGGGLERATWVGTGVFTLASLIAVLAAPARPVVALVDLMLFAAGCVAFLAAYARAVGRSRAEEIGVASLFFLSGGFAPTSVRRSFMVALTVQVVVGLAAAAARPFTPLAFGVLVPVFGLGLAGLWASRFGAFGARAVAAGSPPRGGR